MKSFRIICWIFLALGIGLLGGGIYWTMSTQDFVRSALKAEGKVVELARSRSNNSTTYRPVVKFVTRDNKEVEFVSSFGSNPPSFSVGQRVEVLYPGSAPEQARINSFFSLWGGSCIFAGLGVVFSLVGFGILFAQYRKRTRDEYLRKNGIPIETKFKAVEQDTSTTEMGKHPYRILTEWQNTATGEMHIFRSNYVWFDPTNYITSETIPVFIELNNPKKYVVDLSFLPEVVE